MTEDECTGATSEIAIALEDERRLLADREVLEAREREAANAHHAAINRVVAATTRERLADVAQQLGTDREHAAEHIINSDAVVQDWRVRRLAYERAVKDIDRGIARIRERIDRARREHAARRALRARVRHVPVRIHRQSHARVSHRVGVARVAAKCTATGDPDSDGDPARPRALRSSAGGVA